MYFKGEVDVWRKKRRKVVQHLRLQFLSFWAVAMEMEDGIGRVELIL